MKLIKDILESSDHLLIGGAHDVLSAKIVEDCGYDGIWLSGLGLSATYKALPDASIITASETCQFIINMSTVTNIPIIVDMDSGYGNAANVYYYGKSFARAGANGICIEDNIFPKCNSFYDKGRKDLVSIREMQDKLRALRDAAGNDLYIIARTEAIIAKRDIQEVMERGHAYMEAGADSLLVHASSWDPLQDFLTEWTGNARLTVIPTKFPEVEADILKQYFSIIIYANQALRAATAAMYNILREIKANGLSVQSEKKIASLSEIFRLIDMDKLKELEDRFVYSY